MPPAAPRGPSQPHAWQAQGGCCFHSCYSEPQAPSFKVKKQVRRGPACGCPRPPCSPCGGSGSLWWGWKAELTWAAVPRGPGPMDSLAQLCSCPPGTKGELKSTASCPETHSTRTGDSERSRGSHPSPFALSPTSAPPRSLPAGPALAPHPWAWLGRPGAPFGDKDGSGARVAEGWRLEGCPPPATPPLSLQTRLCP